MSQRQVLQGGSIYYFDRLVSIICIVFEQYQKARTQFVQTVAELASRPQNIETLQNAGMIVRLKYKVAHFLLPRCDATAASIIAGCCANCSTNSCSGTG